MEPETEECAAGASPAGEPQTGAVAPEDVGLLHQVLVFMERIEDQVEACEARLAAAETNITALANLVADSNDTARQGVERECRALTQLAEATRTTAEALRKAVTHLGLRLGPLPGQVGPGARKRRRITDLFKRHGR
jgi:hypothetical protein